MDKLSIFLILTILSFGLLLYALIKKIRPWWKKLLTIVLALLSIFLAGRSYLFPLLDPLEPSGPYTTASKVLFFSHATEFKEMETQEGSREIPVSIWYPEDKSTDKLPLLLFSPGSFGLASSNESLFLELASNGVLVASIDHPYHAFSTRLSDGESISVDSSFLKSVVTSPGSADLAVNWASLKEWMAIRLEDINFVLDSLLENENNNPELSKIDKDKIILSGHSLGGSAALQVARQRAQEVAALVILESPFAGDIVGIEGKQYKFVEEDYPQAILHFYSDALWRKMDQIATYKVNQYYLDKQDAKYKNVHIRGSGHLGLTDMSLSTPVLTNTFDGGLNTLEVYDKLKILNEETLDFLQKYNLIP